MDSYNDSLAYTPQEDRWREFGEAATGKITEYATTGLVAAPIAYGAYRGAEDFARRVREAVNIPTVDQLVTATEEARLASRGAYLDHPFHASIGTVPGSGGEELEVVRPLVHTRDFVDVDRLPGYKMFVQPGLRRVGMDPDFFDRELIPAGSSQPSQLQRLLSRQTDLAAGYGIPVTARDARQAATDTLEAANTARIKAVSTLDKGVKRIIPCRPA